MHTKTIKGRPYFYTTQREGSKTKTIYLGSERADALEREHALKGNGSHTLFLLLVVFILLVGSGLTLFLLKGTVLSSTGFTVTDIGGAEENILIDFLENISDANLSQNISDVQVPVENTALIPPADTNEPSDIVVDDPVEDSTVEPDVPVPDVVLPFQDEMPEENISESRPDVPENNETEEKQNISEEIPSVPEMNDTEDVLQNLTEEIVPLNESVPLVNETLTSSVSEKIIQAQAVIGVPVQWTKHVVLDGEAPSLEVSLPRDVENVSVKKVVDAIAHDIDETHIRVNESGIVSDFSSTDYAPGDGAFGGLFTGFVVSSSPRISLEKIWHSLSLFFLHIVSITGFAVAEEPSDVTLIIDEPVQEIFVEYYTAAPEALEEETDAGKHIDVTSPVAYTNVVAFTDVPNVPADAIQLYAVVNGMHVAQTFSASDTDGDTLIDSITWVIPEIAAGETESYDVALNILTVQSYPLVGGDWAVAFSTTGTADLHIRAVSGTEFGRDIDFVDVRCGDTVVSMTLTNGEVFIANYSCADTGVEVSHVLKAGVHTLEFTFGDIVAYAFNDATNAPTQGAAKINSSTGFNITTDNISIFNVSTADADNDPVKNIYNWMLNDALFNYVNIPMEGGSNSTWTRNYANFSTYGRVINGNWTNTSGYDRKGAYHFNGSTDVIEVFGTEPLGDDLKNFSVEYWFMRNGSGTAANNMIAAVAKGGGFPNGFAAGVLETNGTIVWMMRSTPYATTWTVQNGTWYHVVFAVETNNVTIFINGVANISRTVQASAIGANAFNITIGALQTGAGTFTAYFNGTIDEVRVWNMSLTAQEVDLLYRNQSNVIHSSLTEKGDNFTGQIYPNDLFIDGAGVNASLLVLSNGIPTQGAPIINSTSGNNISSDNITIFNTSTSDGENDPVKNIYNWYKNDIPIAILNLPFEGGSNGTFTKDYSGGNHNGNVSNGSNITWSATSGYDGGGAYHFDRANDSIEINFTNMPTNSSTGLTMAVWFKPDLLDSKWQFIMGSSANALCDSHVYMVLIPSGAVRFSWKNASGSGVQKVLDSNIISVNKWWHITTTLYPNGTASIYLNGKLNKTASDGGRIKSSTGSIWRIGSFGVLCGLTYWPVPNGTIDEVMWFNESLTAQQVAMLYANQTHMISSTMITTLDNWTGQVYPVDNQSAGTALNASLYINTAPTITNFFMNTTDPQNRTNGTINVSFGTSDADGNTVRYQIDWYLNNALNMTFANQTNITNGNTTKGDNFTAIVAVNDGTAWGTNSTGMVIIQNDPPSQPSQTSPTNATRTTGNNQSLTCSSTDLDNDAIYYVFYADTSNPPTTLKQNATGTSYGLSTTDGQTYWWYCKTHDNQSNSGNSAIRAFTENTAPTISGLNVNTTYTANLTNATVNASFSVSDAESDTVRFQIDWYLNNALNMTFANQTNVSAGNTTRGDNFTAIVAVNDGYEWGTNSTGTVIITNTLPTVNNFFINTSDPQNRSNGTINVSFGTSDVDGNTVRYQIDWWLNNALNMTFANQTNISAGNTTKGDNFTAIVAVHDGTAWGTNQTGTVIITNTPPSIGSLVINSTNGRNSSNDNISVYNLSSFDEDNDTTKNIYQWYRNGAPFEVLNMPFESNNSYADGYTKDYSSNNNSGLVVRSFWNASGGFDRRGAYNFSSGNAETINVTDSDSLDFTSEATFALWFSSSISSSNTTRTILVKGNTTAENYVIAYREQSRNLLVRNGTGTGVACGSAVLNFDRSWQHLAYRMNGSLVYFYVNGTRVCSTAWVFGPTGSDPLVIGGRSAVGGSFLEHLEGAIDDVRIYNVSLSDDQIRLLSLNQTHVIHSSLTNPTDNWTAQVYPTENQSTGTALNASLYINTAPTITNFFMNTTDPQNRTNGTINVSFGTSDADGNTVRYQIDWYLNNALNMTFANQTNITAGNTTRGDNFTPIVAVYDGKEWGTNQTGTVIIANTQPVIGSLVINTTTGTNLTSENISVFNLSVTDGDNDSLKSIYNWYRNTEPFFILHTPFEGGSNNTSTKDYSGRSVNVIVNGSFWNGSGGYDRHGTYTFDGVNDFLELPNTTLFTTSLQTEFTIMAWIYNNGDGSIETIYGYSSQVNNETIAIQMNTANSNIPVFISNGTARQLQGNASARAYLRGWAHVAVTYKQGSYIRIYINGSKKVEVAPTINITAKQQPASIGAQFVTAGGSSTNNWNGTIDDFVLLNTSLSDQQILLYYQNQTNILHSTATVKENWTAQVSVADNDTDSGAFNATLTLLNTLATIDNFFINTSDPQNRSNGTVNVSFGLTDLDNDSLMYQIDWYLNNALNRTFANQTNITAGNTSRADNFTAIVAVFDGTAWGTNQTGFVIINNTPPIPVAIISPNSTDIWNKTRLINWTLSVDDANDDWYYNLTLTNTDNTTNTTIATNLNRTNSTYSWNASSVKDGQFRINITTTENNTDEKFSVTNVSDLFNISTSETISPPVTEPGTGGGGGSGAGGGGGEGKKKVKAKEEVEEEFMVDVTPDTLKFELAQGEEDEKTITIQNAGDVARTISFQVVGVDKYATLSEKQLTLQPGEEQTVTVYVISSNATGIFTGNINVEVDGSALEIPLIIEVQSKTVLFDARVDLDPEFVALSLGEELPVEVTLFSIGAPRKVDVKLQYSVRDIYGNILWTSSETMAVDQQVTFSKNFQVPGNLPDGTYVFGLEVLYLNSVATSSVTFDALHTLEMPFFKQNFVLFLTLLVVAFVAAAGVYIIFTIKGGKPRRRK